MMQKKGQITVFILIGIIILMGVSMMYYIRSINIDDGEILEGSTDLKSDKSAIVQYTRFCQQNIVLDAVYVIARQGGHFPVTEYKSFRGYNVTYSFVEGSSVPMLTLSQIADNLGAYVDSRLPECVNHFQVFKDKGLVINEGEISTKVTILDEKVFFETSYDIQIVSDKKNNYSNSISGLPMVEVPVRLGIMYNISKQIVGWISEDPTLIPNSDIQDLMDKYGMQTSIESVDHTTVYVIEDPKSSIKGNIGSAGGSIPYIYVFGGRFI